MFFSEIGYVLIAYVCPGGKFKPFPPVDPIIFDPSILMDSGMVGAYKAEVKAKAKAELKQLAKLSNDQVDYDDEIEDDD